MVSRRQFLGQLGIGAAALGYTALNGQAIGRALAAGAAVGAFVPSMDTVPRDPITHVITRLTYGVTPELYLHVRQIGAQAFIEEQLAPQSLDDSVIDPLIEPLLPILNQNGGILAEQYQMDRGRVIATLIGAQAARQIQSARQLYERMVQFWGDHFSVFIGKGPVLFLKVDDDRDVIRTHAFGRFRDLLGASAHSPAMLIYLDNAQNESSAPNENYARELMELHTLGVSGGYTEDDVAEVARILTGWSVEGREGDPVRFRFRRLAHDWGEKTALGTRFQPDGESEGEQLLDLLAAHPATARFIATKLVRRFIADTPPAAAVARVEAAFTASSGDLPATLRALFDTPEFWAAPPKLKQPLEHISSLFRALGYTITNPLRLTAALRDSLDTLGNIPFTWPAPDGFPDVQSAWQDGLLTRWNLAIGAVGGEIPGAQWSADPLLALLQADGVPTDTGPVLTYFGQYLFGRPLSTVETDILLTFARDSGGSVETQIMAGLALLLASPAFQYR